MSRANDSAFPLPTFQRQDGYIEWGQGGLTVREEFAKAAMQGILVEAPGEAYTVEGAAARAVHAADALIAELAKPTVDRLGPLVAAITALLPEVESEIEQRKFSGVSEDWQKLDELVNAVREALP